MSILYALSIGSEPRSHGPLINGRTAALIRALAETSRGHQVTVLRAEEAADGSLTFTPLAVLSPPTAPAGDPHE